MNDDTETLDKLMNPGNHCRGLHTAWRAAEAAAMNNRIKFTAENGLTGDVFTLKKFAEKIAAHSRTSYANGTPFDAAIRTYRAQNRDLTYRRGENKDAMKLKAKNFRHVSSFSNCLKSIAYRHPGIFGDPSCL